MSSNTSGLFFDPNGLMGLEPGFLQNLVAEGLGTVLGIVISIAVAIWLDRQREANRHQEHRGRAVTRWVKNHSDMIDDLVAELPRGMNTARRVQRQEIVKDAERDAKDIRDDYASALKKNAIIEAFEEYVRTLKTLGTQVSDNLSDLDAVSERINSATEALKKLVQKAGARRSILQTEPIFNGLPPELSNQA